MTSESRGGPWRRLRHVVSTVKDDGRSPVFACALSKSRAWSQDAKTRTVENRYLLDEYIDLIAAIVRSGLEYEGPDYLRTKDGQYWCWMGGIEPDMAWGRAVNH